MWAEPTPPRGPRLTWEHWVVLFVLAAAFTRALWLIEQGVFK